MQRPSSHLPRTLRRRSRKNESKSGNAVQWRWRWRWTTRRRTMPRARRRSGRRRKKKRRLRWSLHSIDSHCCVSPKGLTGAWSCSSSSGSCRFILPTSDWWNYNHSEYLNWPDINLVRGLPSNLGLLREWCRYVPSSNLAGTADDACEPTLPFFVEFLGRDVDSERERPLSKRLQR